MLFHRDRPFYGAVSAVVRQVTMVICEFLPKTAYPMVFTEEGIVISEISVSKNASSPIDSTPFSIVTEESAWQTERRTYGVRTLREDDVYKDDLKGKHGFWRRRKPKGKAAEGVLSCARIINFVTRAEINIQPKKGEGDSAKD